MSTAAAAHHPSAPQEVDVFTMLEEPDAHDFHSNMPSNTYSTHEDEGDDDDDDDDTMMMQAFLEEACDGEDCAEDPASFVMVDNASSVATEQQQQFLAATAAASTFRQVSDSTHGTHPTTASVTGGASTIGTNAAADSNAEEDMDDTMDTGNNNNLTTWETPMMEAAVSPSPPPSAGIHHPTAAPAAAEEQAAAPFSSLSVTGRPPIPLYLSCNPDHLSPYQCAIRKQVELFEATSFDLQARIKGRNKPIVLGQVGIRCTHCRGIAPQDRDRGSMYYPHALVGIYQAAQILSQQHLLEACQQVPPAVRAELADLKSQKSPATAGKEYWAATAKVLGVYEDAHGLRFERRLGYARGLVEPH